MKNKNIYVDPIFFYPTPRVKLIKNLPIRERGVEGEKALLGLWHCLYHPLGILGMKMERTNMTGESVGQSFACPA